MRVVVGISGGVDSSVTAAILKQAGFEVYGVFLKFNQQIGEFIEPKYIADLLGVKFYEIDLQERFRTEIIDYVVNSYASGFTPNPCIECNRRLKIPSLLEFSKEIKAEFTATGHYARIICQRGKEGNVWQLLKASNGGNDQCYFLYKIKREWLPKMIFPVGDKSKEKVRCIAKKLGLPVSRMYSSTDVCFAADYRKTVKFYLPSSFKRGEIVDLDGKVLGQHNGIANYTIGQRKGICVAKGYPLYVVDIDVNTGRIIVGPKKALERRRILIRDCNWFYDLPLSDRLYTVKVRYRQKEVPCRITFEENDCCYIVTDEPVYGVARGQSAVIYDNDRVVGGGVIVDSFIV